MKIRFKILFFLWLGWVLIVLPGLPQNLDDQAKTHAEQEGKLLEAMHSISSHELLAYVQELCSEKFGGRLISTPEYNAAAQWVADLLKEWGIKPAGDNFTYFQDFPNPYTLVLPGSEIILHIPYKNSTHIEKHYRYEKDFLPGSTSDTGTITAEVVYVGYGISAPEFNFDEYKGLDVRGKIVLMEREVPISADKEAEIFKKWRPYSFHQYKVKNAADHRAAGMIYNYHIANPNCLFIKGLVLTYVGQSIVDDLFLGTGRTHKKNLEKIRTTRTPQSFRTGKRLTIKNFTQHHPEGIGRSVFGVIEGSDPLLKEEIVVIGAHLDHLGRNHELMPGANDNASGVAVVLGTAKALTELTESSIKNRRSILFAFFGAEEQGVKGSEYFLSHPPMPKKKIAAFINLDGVGRGTKISALAGKNYPQLFHHFDQANRQYIHRLVTPSHFHNLARPRLDAAHFMWAGIPTISFSTSGAEPLPYSTYHKSTDAPAIITPEIMEDLAQLIFLAVMKM